MEVEMLDNLNIKCTLCGCAEVELQDYKIRNITDDSCKMYKCKNCETHFMYPLPSQDLSEYYDGTFREEVHTADYYDYTELDKVFNNFLSEAKLRTERVKNDLSVNDTILEIGSSVGYFTAAISDYAKDVYATEWDSKARAHIKDRLAKYNIHVAKDPEDFETKFDKIFMFHVLEHIEKPIDFLKNLKQLLNENGKIYIEVPNVDDVMLKTFRCRPFIEHYYKKAHIFNYNEKGLEYIFDNCNFSNYKIRQIQRYNLSNNLYWLSDGRPSGRQSSVYKTLITDALNKEYIASLIKNKQADTLFAVVDK